MTFRPALVNAPFRSLALGKFCCSREPLACTIMYIVPALACGRGVGQNGRPDPTLLHLKRRAVAAGSTTVT